MRVLIAYDTLHGNTEKIARAIAARLQSAGEVVVKKMEDTEPDDVRSADLVVAGCPVHAWSMSRGARAFVKALRRERFEGKRAAAFDTKFQSRLAGGAAKRLLRQLEKRGFQTAADPESFFVTGMEGPLKEGEIERARIFGVKLGREYPSG